MEPTLKHYIQFILDWALARNIIGQVGASIHSLLVTQKFKFMSELGEYCDAVVKQVEPEIKDAIGDMFVVSCSIAYLDMANATLDKASYTHSELIAKVQHKFDTTLEPDTATAGPTTIEGLVYDLSHDVKHASIRSLWNTLFILALHHDTNLLDCVKGAYETIKDRTGKTLPNGNFVKDK